MVEQKNYEIGFLFHVRYLDHVLFKNVDSGLCKPVMREVVGWLVKENDEAMWIVCEQKRRKSFRPESSGLRKWHGHP